MKVVAAALAALVLAGCVQLPPHRGREVCVEKPHTRTSYRYIECGLVAP